jgi:hypothetical protein
MSDSLQPRHLGSIAELLMWALTASGIAYLIPWLTYALEPYHNDSGWTTSVPFAAWVLTTTVGAAGLMAGGRARQIGAAIMIGGVSGAALFLVIFYATV